MLETSASETLYGGQFTLWTKLSCKSLHQRGTTVSLEHHLLKSSIWILKLFSTGSSYAGYKEGVCFRNHIMFSSSIQRYKQHPVSDQVLKLRKLFSKVLKIKLRWPHIFSLVILVSSAFFLCSFNGRKKFWTIWFMGLFPPRTSPWYRNYLGKEDDIDRHFTFVGAT